MTRLSTLGILCTSLFAGCGIEPADASDLEPTPEPGAASDTEQQAATSAPTIYSAGGSTATLIPSATGMPGVAINGGTQLGAYASASYRPSSNPNAINAELTLNPAPGAAFVYYLYGPPGKYPRGEVRLQRLPGSDALQATTSRGNVVCGSLASGTPTTLTIAFDPASHTFDVLFGGAASSCTDLPTRVQFPLTVFGIMDSSNDGWGGRVDLTAPTLY